MSTERGYSQWNAMWAITRGSLRAITRSPSALIFSFIFPFIFILVFGFIGQNRTATRYRIAFDPKTDTTNRLYRDLVESPDLIVIPYADTLVLRSDLLKGRLTGVVNITPNPQGQPTPFTLHFRSASSSNDQWPQFRMFLEHQLQQTSSAAFPQRPDYARFAFNPATDVEQVREYRTIDFILPGQLGFSLLSAGVFGVAFMFFNLRNALVLKRFFATPIRKPYIILGEALSRVLFQMLTAVTIIAVGHFLFGFTLVNGWQTFADMLVLSFVGLVVFMGFGFIVSGIARNDSTIPPFANLITLPQFLLGGTFFSTDLFPSWLQPISRALPLTHLNTALRDVAFEGQSLWQVRAELLILVGWGILVYALAVRFFRWE